MVGPLIRIRYDGGAADRHEIDMRQLGESLQGLDRIISDGVIVMAAQRVPRKGERAPLVLRIEEPRAGSYGLDGFLQDMQGVLALGIPIFTQFGADLISEWVKSVVYFFGDRREQAEKSMDAILECQRMHLAARDAAEARHHEREMRFLDVLTATRGRLGSASAQAVSPVGRSVRQLRFTADDKPELTIDEAAAERVREHGDIEWHDPQSMVLRTDGFTFHTGKLSVEHPGRAGYLLAEVVDPVFKEEMNVYTQAAQQKARIRVLAKPGYRADQLVALTIMHFEGILDDAGGTA